MVDVELLKEAISDSGIPITTICERAGIKRESFYNKLENPNTFKVPDIDGLTLVLRLTKSKRDAIFFAKDAELDSAKV